MNFRKLLPIFVVLLLLGNSCKKSSSQILPPLPGSWTAMSSPQTSQMISTNTGLVAISSDSVYYSSDHASTWSLISNVPAIAQICVDLQNNARVVACSKSDSALYISTNAGQSWSILNQISVNDSISLLAVSGSRLFAIRIDHRNTPPVASFLLKSDNMGSTWDTATFDFQPLTYNQLLFKNNTLFLTTTGKILKSTDNGTSWITQNGSSPVNIYIGITNNGGIIGADFLGNIYQSKDTCQTWLQIFNHDLAPAASVSLGSGILFNTSIYEGAYLVCGNPDKKIWYNASTGLGNGTPNIDNEYVYLIPSIQNLPTMIYRRPLSDFSGL